MSSKKRSMSPTPSPDALYPVEESELDQYREGTSGPVHPQGGTAEAADARLLPERRVPVDAISPSPYQPEGRPAVAAIRAIEAALDALRSVTLPSPTVRDLVSEPTGAALFDALSSEAQALALLAADLYANGQDEPLNTRRVDERFELLSGHRRLAAARLAGLPTVWIREHQVVSDEYASDWVGRGNLFREGWRPWHQAVLVERKRVQRAGAGLSTSNRALGAVMGCSHTLIGCYKAAIKAFPESLLRELGEGSEVTGRELMARLQMGQLARMSGITDPQQRLEAVRAILGVGRRSEDASGTRDVQAITPATPPAHPSVLVRNRRGGA